MINLLSLAYAEYTAKSVNVGFRQLVQLFVTPTNPVVHLPEKISFINPQKNIVGVNECAHKY